MARLIVHAVKDEVCLECWDWCPSATGHLYGAAIPVVHVELVDLRRPGRLQYGPNGTTPSGRCPVEIMWVDTFLEGGTPG